MSKYRHNLPQLNGNLFLTDGGLETTLVFNEGYDLPEFAAFTILRFQKGVEVIRKYYYNYIDIAKKNKFGFILESATWRASSSWGEKIGFSKDALAEMNMRAIRLLSEIRDQMESETTPMVISGCIGPRGDGYNITAKMTAEQAEEYHTEQIKTLSETEADIVSAFTINYTEEAIGITRAAQKIGIPAVISFTVETDGNLPSGQSLGDAIVQVDSETGSGPVYYMINCAHPSHFANTLLTSESWVGRIRGVRANASSKSHAELDNSEELDSGDPQDLSNQYLELRKKLANLTVLGGCCGTDHRHIEKICTAFT